MVLIKSYATIEKSGDAAVEFPSPCGDYGSYH